MKQDMDLCRLILFEVEKLPFDGPKPIDVPDHDQATREQLHIVRTLNEALGLLGVASPQFHRTNAA